jgi:transaldolase
LKLFLDSANASAWRLPPGCPAVCGVTTNPSLVHQAGLPLSLGTYLGLIERAAQQRLSHLMLQLPSSDASQAQHWAQALATAAKAAALDITLKLPCHPDWQGAIQAVQQLGLPVLLTGVANPVQLLWAAEQGANYVAPYIGRLQADGRDVWPFIEACVAVQRGGGPLLLAASVKTGDVLSRLLALGTHAVTLRPEFVAGLAQDPLTNTAMTQFDADARASLGS